MCGRFAMNKETDELITEFVASGGDFRDWRPAYSIAPTDPAPIVREWRDEAGDLHRNLDVANWGFRPSWAKQGGPSPINARLEGVASNGMFRSAFTGQRCLVPMIGYYEWEQQPDGKQPYFIHSGDDFLAAAGLYAARREGDDWKITFTIITRAARDASGEIHDRMPVFLTADAWDQWIAPEKIKDSAEALATLDASSSAIASTMTTYPVDRKLNNVRTADPEDETLIARI
ncbi:Putative SOS response-associated peptidase YedK [Paramicrobacterium humi]|uniref:Abasic site processing protein n=1 Tax=Paramicrobacterium humi TaxID=640635 RepID=A0A1H4KDY7_9MICO|nr:Putative SOS response-associated peptidase YedK [Microbacterium humi]